MPCQTLVPFTCLLRYPLPAFVNFPKLCHSLTKYEAPCMPLSFCSPLPHPSPASANLCQALLRLFIFKLLFLSPPHPTPFLLPQSLTYRSLSLSIHSKRVTDYKRKTTRRSSLYISDKQDGGKKNIHTQGMHKKKNKNK